MSNSKTGSEGENLSRIRDILFGEDLQSIESKLAFFKKENSEINESLKKEFEDRLAKIEQVIDDKSLESNDSLNKHIDDQVNTNKDIKQEILKSEERFKSESEEIKKSLIEKTNDILAKLADLDTSLNQTINNIKKEHEASADELNANKVSKEAIAELLIELANKLKK